MALLGWLLAELPYLRGGKRGNHCDHRDHGGE